MNSFLQGGKRSKLGTTFFIILIYVNAYFSFSPQDLSLNATIGHQFLKNHGFNYGRNFYWISVGALLGFWMVLNIGFTCALNISKGNFLLNTTKETSLCMIKARIHRNLNAQVMYVFLLT